MWIPLFKINFISICLDFIFFYQYHAMSIMLPCNGIMSWKVANPFLPMQVLNMFYRRLTMQYCKNQITKKRIHQKHQVCHAKHCKQSNLHSQQTVIPPLPYYLCNRNTNVNTTYTNSYSNSVAIAMDSVSMLSTSSKLN